MRFPILFPATLLTVLASSPASAQIVNWSQVSTTDLQRSGHVISFFEGSPGNGRILLHSGVVNGATTTDTFEFNGLSWTQQFPLTAPPQRWSTAVAFDRLRRRVVLFGGQFGPNFLNDTWEWDGTNWTQMASGGPSPRRFHAMAFDAARGRTVLFGGEDPNGAPLGDTWEWSGVAWNQVSSSGPSPRRSHAMAFDLNRQRLVLYGGTDALAIKSDTLEWNGTTWTLMSTPFVNPGASADHSLVYDAARERTVFFNTSGFATFEWDGINWVRTFPSASPSVGTTRQQLAFDERRAVMVFASGGFAGTWDYGPVSPATFTSFGAGCPGTGGLVPVVAPAGLGELPWIGDSFVIRLSNLQLLTSQVAFVLVGFSNPALNLTPFGAPGCTGFSSGETTFTLNKPVFVTAVNAPPVPIPNNPAFIGAQLFAQGAVTDTVNALGLVVSNGGLYVVGQR